MEMALPALPEQDPEGGAVQPEALASHRPRDGQTGEIGASLYTAAEPGQRRV